MYDSRSWFSSRVLVGFCVCVWFFVGASSALALTNIPYSFSNPLIYNGYKYTLQKLGSSSSPLSVWNGGSSGGDYISLSGTSLYRVIHVTSKSADGKTIYYDYYSVFSSLTWVDSDGDGAYDPNDPCPDSVDNYFKNYRVSNTCDGTYYFFQITGECGETKTYFNPKYSSVNEAYSDSMAHSECTSISYGSFTPEQFEKWQNSHSGDADSGGNLDFDSANSIDPTGSTGTNSTGTTEVDSDDESAQDIIDAIKLMRDKLGDKVDSQTTALKDKMQIETDRVVSAVRTAANNVNSFGSTLGTAISGTTSAITASATQAHTDAEALKKAIEGIEGGNATVSGGITSDDMKTLLEEQRQLIYEADTSIDSDTASASHRLINSITGIVGMMQGKVQGLLPALSVQTASPSSCIDGGTITFPDGTVHQVNGDICLTPYESHFVMVGNILYAYCGIVGILSLFGVRRG